MKHKILVVDDDRNNLTSTGALLERWGYSVDAAESGDGAIQKIKSPSADYAVLLLDYNMPGKNGSQTAKEIRVFNSDTVILIYSAYPSADNILASLRAGTVDFIDKTEDVQVLKKALEAACIKFEETKRTLKPKLDKTAGEDLLKSLSIVGSSPNMVDVALRVKKFRGSKKPILILGETGTGKELVAHALRVGQKESFAAINCAAFTNNDTIASELFGHEKGAFTGAISRKIGIFESVQGGTIFLDEVHCLSLEAQQQLFRAIREKKIRRVGGNQEYSVDFKLIAAAKPNLEQMVKEGKFTADLYYRLNYLTITLPPLRERLTDIAPLVLFFCDKHYKETGERKSFLMKTIRLLEKHNWPGNVGELEGQVFNLLARTDGPIIEPQHLDAKFFDCVMADPIDTTTLPSLDAFYEREKRSRIESAINSCSSISQAAEKLGIGRTTLHTLLTRMGLRSQFGSN